MPAGTGRAVLRSAACAAGLALAVVAGFAAQAWWRHPLTEAFRAGKTGQRASPHHPTQAERLFREVDANRH